MRHKKPLAVRIFIRICVVFMAVSLIGAYVIYMFSPNQEAGETDANVDTGDIQAISGDVQIIDEILPEVNPDEPENSSAPIIITEEVEADDMNQLREVQLENGETELVRQGDLGGGVSVD